MVRINKGFCMAASRSLSAKTAASCDPPEVSRAAQVKDNPGRKYECMLAFCIDGISVKRRPSLPRFRSSSGHSVSIVVFTENCYVSPLKLV